MKRVLAFEFTPEEKASLEAIENIDICADINCSSFDGCTDCPLKRATELKDELDKVLRNARRSI